jgi:hypothetical protein
MTFTEEVVKAPKESARPMESRVANSAGWMLVLAAVLLLAISHRLDLLIIVAPIAMMVSIWIAWARAGDKSSQRKM